MCIFTLFFTTQKQHGIHIYPRNSRAVTPTASLHVIIADVSRDKIIGLQFYVFYVLSLQYVPVIHRKGGLRTRINLGKNIHNE